MEGGQGFALGPLCLGQSARILSGKDVLVRLAQAVPGVEEEVDVPPLFSRELVDRPRRDRRLAELLDLLRGLAIPGRPQLAHEAVTLGNERLGLEPVEPIELSFEVVHSPSVGVRLRRRSRTAVPVPPARLQRTVW